MDNEPQPTTLAVVQLSQLPAVQPVRDPNQMLTYAEVGLIFGVTAQTIMAWVKKGQFPPPKYFGASARIPVEDVTQVRLKGLQPPGTYVPPVTVRSRIGQLGAAAKKDLAIAARSKARKPVHKPKPKKRRK